jgi:hypothetical protein
MQDEVEEMLSEVRLVEREDGLRQQSGSAEVTVYRSPSTEAHAPVPYNSPSVAPSAFSRS